MLAIFLASPVPPTWPTAKLKIAAAPCSIRRAKSNLVVSRSPVAIGIVVRRATSARAFMFSGGQGSSYQSGSNFSRRRAIRSAPAGGHLAVRADDDVAGGADLVADGADHPLGGVGRGQGE